MIRCIAIDDEPIALSIIEEYCRQYGGVELECYTSPEAGMERIREVRPDIVFLDIEMNSYNGLALAPRLPEETCLILTTAYPQYALDGFEADAVDFLHKPIFYPRFVRAMEKAVRWLGGAVGREGAVAAGSGTIVLKVEHKSVVAAIDEIILVEAMDNYVKIYRRDRPVIVSQITMKEIEAMLPQAAFCRVHRSFIVALGAVDRFTGRRVALSSGREVPVGRKYMEAFRSRWQK